MASKPMTAIRCLVISLILLSGCNGNRIYESFEEFPDQHWLVADTVSFTVDSLPAAGPKLLSVGIRYNDSYEYHNLYMRFLLRDSLNNIQLDSLINLQLFDPKTGQPLGSGFGNRRVLYDTLPSSQLPVSARVQFIHYMRKDTLMGIESVGFKIAALEE